MLQSSGDGSSDRSIVLGASVVVVEVVVVDLVGVANSRGIWVTGMSVVLVVVVMVPVMVAIAMGVLVVIVIAAGGVAVPVVVVPS